MAKKKQRVLRPKLTKPEEDLLQHMEHGYQLETDSRSADPVLRRMKDGEVIRPTSVTSSTIKAMKERGLIRPSKSHDPLTIVWRVGEKSRT